MGLVLENTAKSFKGFTMTADFSVKNGELLTLLGPSGCGKTTTLQLIAGILKPDSGRIILHGKDITLLEPWKRDIGIVFQDYALFPHMNVAQNISYGLRHRKGSRDRIRETVMDFLDLVHLSGYESRTVDSLSGGEKQRVALARALAPNPALLLLDEPLSALDASLRKDLRREIRKIQKKLNITTVYVTHDQEEALAISDRILIMSMGKTEQQGTPSEIFDRPSTEFSARFMGHSNLLEGEVVSASGKTAVVAVGDTGIFRAPLTQGIKEGDLVWLFFRSTNTVITNKKKHEENTLKGIISCREYYGTHMLYEIENNGRIIKAEYKLDGSSKYQEELEEGKTVSVFIPPDRCYLIERFSRS